MKAVTIISMPDNRRGALFPPDELLPSDADPDDGEDIYAAAARMQWPPAATLPIAMPKFVFVITDENGTPLAMTCDSGRIRRADVATVWQGVLEYNRDLAAREDQV